MLPRMLEPEVMDSIDEAIDYNAMDHSEVNRKFVADFLAANPKLNNVLDLGTGTALIPIELCRVLPDARVTAVDLAASMLEVARENVVRAGLASQIDLVHVDAKRLPHAAGRFSAVISNSIVHHVPEPIGVLAEAVRVAAYGAVIFIRDLMRPDNELLLGQLVDTYAAGCNAHQRQMFTDSLHAALTVDEVRSLVVSLGFANESVQATSDRHWTWIAIKPA